MIISEKWGKIKDTGVPTQHLQEVSKKMFDLSSIKAHP
jgi:2-oxoglutarate dehydrogenase E1 component